MTELTGRQIRYYEESDLIKPARTKGNQRIYSQKDVERLKEIKELLSEGLNIAGIKEKIGRADQEKKEEKIKEINPAYDGRPLTKFNRRSKGLTSLYPVSDRAQLLEILDKKEEKKEGDKED